MEPMRRAMDLLELAKEFDELQTEELAAQLRARLGAHAEEFEARYEGQGRVAATAVLCEMDLLRLPPEAVLGLLGAAAVRIRRSAQGGSIVDWVDLMRRLQHGMLAALEPAPSAARLPAVVPAAAGVLIGLAQAYDSVSADNLEARVVLAEQMKPLLGPHYDDFDRRYSAKERPSALAILHEMGLASA